MSYILFYKCLVHPLIPNASAGRHISTREIIRNTELAIVGECHPYVGASFPNHLREMPGTLLEGPGTSFLQTPS